MVVPAILGGVLVALLLMLSAGLGLWVLRLRREARTDPLTGLANRRGLALGWQRFRGPPVLLFIDLDGFKAVNDRYGHGVGDALLREVAGRMAAAVSPPAVLARWGGDEFVAVTSAADFREVLDRLGTVAGPGYDLRAAGGPAEVRIGLSIGAAPAAAARGGLDGAVALAAGDLLRARQRPRPVP